MSNKTKIVCTLGPASGKKEIIKQLILEGSNAFRLNFSHGEYAQHRYYIDMIRETEKEIGKNVSVIQDLQGPRIRVGKLKNKEIILKENEEIIITSENIYGDNKKITTTYKNFCKDVKINQRILLDDGLLMLIAKEKIKKGRSIELKCEIIKGGPLKENKGINLPDTKISLPAITQKDLNDIDFGIKLPIDMIALSFVRSAKDIATLKKLLKKKGVNIPVIAKIERPEAIKEIDKIIKISDAIMIARGDLGVELSPEEVPVLQKLIISKCNENLKPVITATQMLESMVEKRMPTRAEVSDVANAILDGTDCVMLSAETSIGIDPVNAVRMMSKVIERTEMMIKPKFKDNRNTKNTLETLCKTATEIAQLLNIDTIITISKKGKSPLYLSSHRTLANIFVLTTNPTIQKINNIVWGVNPYIYDGKFNVSEILSFIEKVTKKINKYLRKKAILIYNNSENSKDSADTISIIDLK